MINDWFVVFEDVPRLPDAGCKGQAMFLSGRRTGANKKFEA